MLDFLVSNDLLSTIIAFGIVLIPAIIIHEFGHFIAAKMVGITVLEFGIGFPPRVAKLFTWRETEFTLNIVPLGGFVRPLGEDMIRPVGEEETNREREKLVANMQNNRASRTDEYQSDREELAARGFYETKAVHEATPLQRIVFMAAGAIFNFIFAIALFVFIGLIGLPEEVGSRVGISSISVNSPLAAIGLIEGDVIDSINNQYFADGDELFNQLEAAINTPVTLQIRRPITGDDNTITKITDVELEFTPTQALVDLVTSSEMYVSVTSVVENSPAAQAGIQPDDLITYFNDVKIVGSEAPATTLQDLTVEYAGHIVTLTIIRDGETIEISLMPRADPPAGEGRMGIGIRNEAITPDRSFAFVEGRLVKTAPQPIDVALEYGFDRTVSVFSMIAEFPKRLLAQDTRPEERRIVSVVAVSQMGGELLQDSIEEEEPVIILEYIALISIALGFTNLLPIPALDGGRILFVTIELIRGKPISPEREGIVHLAGLIFMLTIGVIFIINDLINPITDILR